MGVHRVQASLIIRDSDLYEDFILPCKAEKSLNTIIVQCLSAYYRNEQVRDLISGTSDDDYSDSGVVDNQAVCDGLRAALVAQDFFINELKNTIEDGNDDIKSILSGANEKAKDSGVVSPTESKFGQGVDRISPKALALLQTSGDGTQSVDSGNLEHAVTVMLEVLLSLANTVHNQQDIDKLMGILNRSDADNTQQTSENERQVGEGEVVTGSEDHQHKADVGTPKDAQTVQDTQTVTPPVLQDDIETEDELMDVPEPVPEVPEPVVGEATSSLLGLLESV